MRMNRLITLLVVGVLIVGAGLEASAAGYQMQIDFPGYTNRTETLTNFPVLVVFSNNVAGSGFSFDTTPFLSADGYDLRFRDATDTTDLNYEIESWDTNSACYVWVQVPELPTNGTGSIWAKWGTDDTQQPCTTNGATWSQDYENVWHLAQTDPEDSTTTTNDGTASGDISLTDTAPANGGIRFDGNDDYITMDLPSVFGSGMPNDFTFSFWARIEDLTIDPWSRLLEARYDSNNYVKFVVCANNQVMFYIHDSGARKHVPGPNTLNSTDWYHFTGLWDADGSSGAIYVNGTAQTGPVPNNYPGPGAYQQLRLGGRADSGNFGDYTGWMDEMRISTVMRSADWIWADYMTVASNLVFTDYGPAYDPELPGIATRSESGLDENVATLNGTLSRTGTSVTAVSVYWEQGADQGESTGAWANVESFGEYTPALGGLPHDYETNITSLAAGTTYSYRYYATNDSGEAWGDAVSFTTPQTPGAPTLDAPADIAPQSVRLSGTANGGLPAPEIYFCLNPEEGGGTGSTGDWARVVSAGTHAGAFTNTIYGLAPGTKYYVRIFATNEMGAAWSEADDFTTVDVSPSMMKISFPGYTNRTVALTDFPVLVVFSNNVGGSGFDFGATPFLSGEGYDLRFRDSGDTTNLNYEIEKWDTNTACYVWVQVDEIPADGSGYIWAKWGDLDNAVQLACTTNGATWSNGYVGVWHLSETSGDHADSTSNDNTGINYASDQTAVGKIAGGNEFSGAGQRVEVDGSAASFAFADDTYSISAWLRTDSVGGNRVIVDNAQAAGSGFRFRQDDANLKMQNDFGFADPGPIGGTIVVGQWHHVVATVNGNSATVYIDGDPKATAAIDLYVQNNKAISIGDHADDSGSSILPLDGRIDEVRISEDVWSADWIWAAYMTAASNEVFSGYGGVQELSGDAPLILTLAVSGLGENGATLNGNLSSAGTSVTAVSVYWDQGSDQGTNTTDWMNEEPFGNYTPALGTLPHAYATNITALTPNTTYSYRYYATNDTGETWGDAVSFTTWEAPGVPSISLPSETGFVHVVISGAVNGGNPDPQAWFCLNAGEDGPSGTTSGWDIVESAGTQSGAFTNTITGLVDDTTYYARVYVTNEAGEAWSDVVSFTTEAAPTQLTLDGDQPLDGAAPELTFKEAVDLPLPGVGEEPSWLYNFAYYGTNAIPVNLSTNTLTSDGSQKGTITLDLNGADLSGSNGQAIVTYVYHKVPDNVVITNVGEVAIGGIDTHISYTGYNASRLAGSIEIGSSENRSGPVRVEYLHSYGRESYSDVGQPVTVYSSGDVIIADREGNLGDIYADSYRNAEGNLNDVTVNHFGNFKARSITTYTYSYSGGGNNRAGNVNLNGNDATGDVTLHEILADFQRTSKGTWQAAVTIENYENVTITGQILGKSVSSEGYGAHVIVTNNIVGDITVGGPIDLSRTNDLSRSGELRLACAGTVTLGELDLDKIVHAELSSGSGASVITGAIAGFDTITGLTGSGTANDPYETSETRLRAPADRNVYYSYTPGSLNDDLGGHVWQLKDLDGTSDGGLLMLAPAPGTLLIFR